MAAGQPERPTDPIRFVITEDNASQRLDVILNQLVEEIPSRSFGAKLIGAGFVTLNGRAARPSSRPAAGDVLELDASCLTPADLPPQPENIPLSIVFEDGDLLVVDKPPGLVVHPGAGVSSGTLVNAVLAHCGATLPSLGGPVRAGIVHRLDRDTSGVMVVAKTQRALTGLSAQFAEHSHGRKYQALVFRTPQPEQGHVETNHGRDPRNRLKFAVVGAGQGKRAALHYQTLQKFSGGLFSLIECELETGRTHQIRVQMTHLGCPLIGDALYGAVPEQVRNRTQVWANLRRIAQRQMLHATSLTLRHPVTGTSLAFQAKLPEDFLAVLNFLHALG